MTHLHLESEEEEDEAREKRVGDLNFGPNRKQQGPHGNIKLALIHM